VFYEGGILEAVGTVVEKTSAKKLIQPSGSMFWVTCSLAKIGRMAESENCSPQQPPQAMIIITSEKIAILTMAGYDNSERLRLR
ncbi:hypothetical protein Tco_0893491, partial [Tanacetum coccineum]